MILGLFRWSHLILERRPWFKKDSICSNIDHMKWYIYFFFVCWTSIIILTLFQRFCWKYQLDNTIFFNLALSASMNIICICSNIRDSLLCCCIYSNFRNGWELDIVKKTKCYFPLHFKGKDEKRSRNLTGNLLFSLELYFGLIFYLMVSAKRKLAAQSCDERGFSLKSTTTHWN